MLLQMKTAIRAFLWGMGGAIVLDGALLLAVWLLKGTGGDGSPAMLLAPLFGVWMLPAIVAEHGFPGLASFNPNGIYYFAWNVLLWGLVAAVVGCVIGAIRKKSRP
jgi:hypothetical protein